MNFKERIELIIKELNIRSVFEFVKKTDLGGGTINKIKDRPSENTIAKILKVFPEINREFIEFGTGEIFNSTEYKIENINLAKDSSHNYKSEVEQLKKEIEKLQLQLDEKNKLIIEKDFRIQELKENINDFRNFKNVTPSQPTKQTMNR